MISGFFSPICRIYNSSLLNGMQHFFPGHYDCGPGAYCAMAMAGNLWPVDHNLYYRSPCFNAAFGAEMRNKPRIRIKFNSRLIYFPLFRPRTYSDGIVKEGAEPLILSRNVWAGAAAHGVALYVCCAVRVLRAALYVGCGGQPCLLPLLMANGCVRLCVNCVQVVQRHPMLVERVPFAGHRRVVFWFVGHPFLELRCRWLCWLDDT